MGTLAVMKMHTATILKDLTYASVCMATVEMALYAKVVC